MDIKIFPTKLSGEVCAIPSKSQAHRLLICAAFSDAPTKLHCPETNHDIEATADCLRALGASISRINDGYEIVPISSVPDYAVLDCRESGSTLRFLLPIVAALGVDTIFCLSGRLHKRPLSPLWEELEANGCCLTRPTENTIRCTGKLQPGIYTIDGGVSSQFISGLLFALPLLSGESEIRIVNKLESKPYVSMTQQALAAFGVVTENYIIRPSYPFHSPGSCVVEGDWSNAAFFLTAAALGNNVHISGLSADSSQGDRAIADILTEISIKQTIDAADIPDLVPILAVAASAFQGATFTNISRLRLKESDRVSAVINMLTSLGASASAEENVLTVCPGQYHSCTIDAVGDHRIAMAAAIAATISDGPITVTGAECVCKSYPSFWDEYKKLGGNYEQYIR